MQANINNQLRADIISLHENGHNISQIAKATGLSRNTVSLWVKRYAETGSLATRQRSGRRPLINTFQRKSMVNELVNNGCISTKRFADLYKTSSTTVRRALRAEGLQHRSTSSQCPTEQSRTQVWRQAETSGNVATGTGGPTVKTYGRKARPENYIGAQKCLEPSGSTGYVQVMESIYRTLASQQLTVETNIDIRLKKWIIACKRSDLESLLEEKDPEYFNRTYVVCSDHFDIKCFRNKDLYSQGLLPNSIPTLALYNDTKVPVSESFLPCKSKSRCEKIIVESDISASILREKGLFKAKTSTDAHLPKTESSCVFLNCQKISRNLIESSVSFYPFVSAGHPKRDEWIKVVREDRNDESWLPTELSTVCSAHFNSDDFCLNGNRWTLQYSAVPSATLASHSEGVDVYPQLPAPPEFGRFDELFDQALPSEPVMTKSEPVMLKSEPGCSKKEPENPTSSKNKPSTVKKTVGNRIKPANKQMLKSEPGCSKNEPENPTSSKNKPSTVKKTVGNRIKPANKQKTTKKPADDIIKSRKFGFTLFKCSGCQRFYAEARFACIQCEDYDLCVRCAAGDPKHADHYLLRVPRHSTKDETSVILHAIRSGIKPLLTMEEGEIYATGGDDVTTSGGEDTVAGNEYSIEWDDHTTKGDDDTAKGDDDTTKGDDDSTKGDDDSTKGDDDTSKDDDDTMRGDDDTIIGDDDPKRGDDNKALHEDIVEFEVPVKEEPVEDPLSQGPQPVFPGLEMRVEVPDALRVIGRDIATGDVMHSQGGSRSVDGEPQVKKPRYRTTVRVEMEKYPWREMPTVVEYDDIFTLKFKRKIAFDKWSKETGPVKQRRINMLRTLHNWLQIPKCTQVDITKLETCVNNLCAKFETYKQQCKSDNSDIISKYSEWFDGDEVVNVPKVKSSTAAFNDL